MSPGDYCFCRSEMRRRARGTPPERRGRASRAEKLLRATASKSVLGRVSPPTPQKIENVSVLKYCVFVAGVAQLVRAFPCHGKGRGFESLHSRKTPNLKHVFRFVAFLQPSEGTRRESAWVPASTRGADSRPERSFHATA